MFIVILMELVLVFLAFMLGASLASFAGVVIERVPKGESINGRSHCACGRQLKWYENVPVFGYLFTGGKAKCCGAKLPVWYLFFELGAGLVFGIIGAIIVFNVF